MLSVFLRIWLSRTREWLSRHWEELSGGSVMAKWKQWRALSPAQTPMHRAFRTCPWNVEADFSFAFLGKFQLKQVPGTCFTRFLVAEPLLALRSEQFRSETQRFPHITTSFSYHFESLYSKCVLSARRLKNLLKKDGLGKSISSDI